MPQPRADAAQRLARRQAAFLTILIGFVLYFYGLDRVGMLGPDEPRYASIGREMARSGDWVTPRLWGEPWFEKPALVYWLAGIGFKLGLSDDLAPRVPIALLSVAFLFFFYREVKRNFDEVAATCATAVLATSAGWLAFSQVGVTDLPLAATFAACVLALLRPDIRREIAAGILFGLALLAKGLVPAVLLAPVIVWLLFERRWRAIAVLLLVGIATAAPWYVLCTMRNGRAFIDEFFWKHHFQRFATDALQHQQPVWFYLPVLVAGLFPWSVLVGLIPGRSIVKDNRLVLFTGVVLFGFVFFSVSVNKLPGYLLPLLPFAAALIGVRMAEARRLGWWLVVVAVGLAAYPWVGDILPRALVEGLSRARPTGNYWFAVFPAALLAWQCWRLEQQCRRVLAVIIILLFTTGCVVYLKAMVLPRIDSAASARSVWRRVAPVAQFVCVEDDVSRTWIYGLNYYSPQPFPHCPGLPVRLVAGPNGRPVVVQSEIIR